MQDYYGVFEQRKGKTKEFVKEQANKGLYAVKVMLRTLNEYALEGKYLQEYHVARAPKEMGINDDETKVRRLNVAGGKEMIFFTRKGAKQTFAHFHKNKKRLREYNEEEIFETLDEIASLI